MSTRENIVSDRESPFRIEVSCATTNSNQRISHLKFTFYRHCLQESKMFLYYKQHRFPEHIQQYLSL